MPSSEKTVYLTFDDGPHPEITTWVLEQLKKFDMKATFFCGGDNARKFPDTLNLIRLNGHALGNHTMHHIKGWENSVETYLKDVELCSQEFKTNLFRPPYGRISTKQIKALQSQYKIVMWSLLSCDFDQKLNKEKALKGLFDKTKNGSIIVFHDSVKAENNLRYLLPKYLEFLYQNEYKCNII